MLSATLVNEVQTLSMDELRELDELVRVRWNVLKRARTKEAAAQFSKGMKVQFRDKTGMLVDGVVTKMNRTSVSVETRFGRWNVHPSLLSAVTEG